MYKGCHLLYIVFCDSRAAFSQVNSRVTNGCHGICCWNVTPHYSIITKVTLYFVILKIPADVVPQPVIFEAVLWETIYILSQNKCLFKYSSTRSTLPLSASIPARIMAEAMASIDSFIYFVMKFVHTPSQVDY